ncbi:EAL domain-containing protein [Sulfuricurvum sp.]|uniref:EAL and HDOD domain-containing protein n=1 Tax=Sulfuricurvum sp. TaxID=2025608 RepID=UPI002638B19E|nr:EAL domain-containing protein [Sulfuricurvum sp.]MDD4950610.1 EAL domain-containing protein [Sulfuricurvum sp.]
MSLIGRQPVCNENYLITGYDILFRDEELSPDFSDISISASVLNRILNEFGLESVLGGYQGFLKADIEFLQSNIVTTIPSEHFVLMILESSLFHPELETVLKRLHEKGYRFGLNSCILDSKTLERIESLKSWLSYIRIDVLRSSDENYSDIFKRLKQMKQAVIASKVETHEILDRYKEYGADLYQGYYIKRPHTIENESLSMSQESIVRIWDLLQRDADISVIVKALEQDHALVLQMLQFINSSFFSFSSTITSVKQVISLIGRKAFGNWLLLLLVSHKSGGNTNHPLLLMVINRTEILSGLLMLSTPKYTREELDTAYLVGMLSLIHLLLNMDHREFLHKLHVSAEIEEAMFEAQGRWGQLLTMARHIENMDIESLQPFIKRYNINTVQMNELIAKAMEKVNAFDAMMQTTFL